MGALRFFAPTRQPCSSTSNVCPHKQGPLNEGIVHGTKVTCPLHNWVFDLETGKALGADEGRIETFAARVEDGRVLIEASVLGRKAA